MALFDFLEHKLTIGVIKNKLKKLESLDADRRIFGAESHRYKINPAMADERIDAFEKRFSVKIPVEYRLYLQKIGDGGVGPFYGLYELEYNDDQSPDPAKVFEYVRQKPFRVADFYDSIPDDISEDDHERMLEDVYETATRGLIFLATEGCGIYSVLVVNGKEHGNVWHYDLANDAGIFPLRTPDSGKPMRFFEWYETWLDRSIDSLKTGKDGLSSYAEFIDGD